MNDRRLAFIYSTEVERFIYPEHSPFKIAAATLTRRRLIASGLLDPTQHEVPARPATQAELLQFHAEPYLDELQRASEGQLSEEGRRMGLGGRNTPVFHDMLTCGSWAAGSALSGADLLLEGRAQAVFSLLGGYHHAAVSKASGFCYVNDVVLACMHLAASGKRVACIDVDAHHGDALQEAFYWRRDVLTISLHETGKTSFPWGGFAAESGKGPGLGHNVNVSLPRGTFDAAYSEALDRVVMPLLRAYRPDAIVLVLGMSPLASDPGSHLHLSNNFVLDTMERMLSLPCLLLVTGGGGHQEETTARGWSLAWRMALGASEHEPHPWRDPELLIPEEHRKAVLPELESALEESMQHIFGHHNLAISLRNTHSARDPEPVAVP